MKHICPLCGNVLATNDTFLYTCIECDELFTIEELTEDFDFVIPERTNDDRGKEE